MSVIQNIRERYAKWAGGIIALALVGFVLQDAFSGDSNIRKMFGGNPNSIARVNGSDIDRNDFDRKVQDYQSLSELFNKGKAMSDEDQANLKQQVLDQVIMENLMQKDAEKLGLTVTKSESDLLIKGTDPDPVVKQFFITITGKEKYDPADIKNFEKEVPKQIAASQDQSQRAQLEKLLHQWDAIKSYVVTSRVLQKYNTLVASSVYTPKPIFDRNMQAGRTMAGLRYVKIPYTAINDNEVKVSDADLTAYMEKHRPVFEADQPTRSLEYVVFDIQPDRDDTSRAAGALQGMRTGFASTANNEEFVNRNSEERFNDQYVTKATFKSAFADTILAQPAGSVYGPYFDGGSYKLTKVVSKITLPDSVKCRHILVKSADKGQPTLDSAVAKARIDSVEGAVRSGGDFKAIAAKVSDDPGSKENGGEYTFALAQRSGLSKEFADFIFDGKTGEKKVVRVNNGAYAGYHYIEILSQKNPVPAAKLATISKALSTGQAAYSNTNAKANEFAGKNQTAAAFDNAVKKGGLNKRVADDLKPTDFLIPGLGSARDVIRWAWDAKEGEVSSVMQVGNDKVVVAKLAAIQAPGLRRLSAQIRPQLETVVRNEKKAKIIMGRYKGANLDAIAQSAAQPVQMADSISAASSNTQKLGYEPRVVGYLFNPSFAVNAVSPAIQGREGVFFVQLVHRDAAPAASTNAAGDPMAAQQRSMEDMQAKQAVAGALMQALRKKGSVTYHPKNL